MNFTAITAKFLKAGLAAFLCCFAGCSKRETPAAASFQDDPAAHALYTQMVQSLSNATSLSWTGDYRMESPGYTNEATYNIWLKKPNYARVEAIRKGTNAPCGILVGDGITSGYIGPGKNPDTHGNGRANTPRNTRRTGTRFT